MISAWEIFRNFRWILLIAFGVVLTACVPNEAFRKGDPAICPGDGCNISYLQDHGNDQFDLAFVEFTERGNVFDRNKMDAVLDHVKNLASSDDESSYSGVATIVYVHGWKNNARYDNGNVLQFMELLRQTAALKDRRSNRRLVGIYVGWRGQSFDARFLSNLSYWERKAVAHQVGKGGVSELLLRLERILHDENDPNKNLYLVTGHSFGGAIVLSSLNEILMERIVSGQVDDDGKILTRPFGHGVVLVNPAIEANEIIQFKEIISNNDFHNYQSKLMHIISSNADWANRNLFYWGQLIGTGITWNQEDITRNIRGQKFEFGELDLDTTTVGNFSPFQTGYLAASENNPARKKDLLDDPYYGGPKECVIRARDDSWDYISYTGSMSPGDRDHCIFPIEDAKDHIPVGPNEPLSVIRTDAAFSRDHNDVFNVNIAAYLAAILTEGQHKQIMAKRVIEGGEIEKEYIPAFAGRSDGKSSHDSAVVSASRPNASIPNECAIGRDGVFDFGVCFQSFHRKFCEVESLGVRNETCAP